MLKRIGLLPKTYHVQSGQIIYIYIIEKGKSRAEKNPIEHLGS